MKERAYLKRRLIWKHNSYMGNAAMTRTLMRSIEGGVTVSQEAQDLARQIENLSMKLGELLIERDDDQMNAYLDYLYGKD